METSADITFLFITEMAKFKIQRLYAYLFDPIRQSKKSRRLIVSCTMPFSFAMTNLCKELSEFSQFDKKSRAVGEKFILFSSL